MGHRDGVDRQLEKGNVVPDCFTSDSRLVAVTINVDEDDKNLQSIKIYSVPEWKLVRTIIENADQCDAGTFAAGDRILVGTVGTMKSKNDYENLTEQLKFWDLDSGDEELSVPPPDGSGDLRFKSRHLTGNSWPRRRIPRLPPSRRPRCSSS